MTTLTASDIAARRIRETRQKRGWRVKDLADACKKAGAAKITPAVITNLETRRRPGREITAEELLALAWVLEVPPVQLLSPLDGTEALEIVPGEDRDPVDAAAWLADEDSSLGPVKLAASSSPAETERVLRYRDSPLIVIRQIRAASRAVLFHDRLEAAEKAGQAEPWAGRHEAAITTLGVRLLHLIVSLEALGYSRPPLTAAMDAMARHGIPPTLAEWEQMQESGEVPGGEST